METIAPKILRVCVTGAECTGKTTLAQELASHFGTVWVPEYAREYALAVRRELSADDVEPIARGQVANEESGLTRATRLVVLDTDLISTNVYADYYYGDVPAWIVEEATRRRADLYLFLDIDVPYVADPARDAEADRPLHFEAFERAFARFGVERRLISGGWDERKRKAIEAVEGALMGHIGQIGRMGQIGLCD